MLRGDFLDHLAFWHLEREHQGWLVLNGGTVDAHLRVERCLAHLRPCSDDKQATANDTFNAQQIVKRRDAGCQAA